MLDTLQLKSVTCQHLNEFVNTTKGCNNNNMNTPGQRLREAREAAGYTQEELAEMVGKIKQQSIQKIEADVIQNPRKLPIIESVLGLPPGYIKYGNSGAPGLPRPVIARCPILSWEDAYGWPENKSNILNENIERLANKLILNANCYALRVKDNSMLNELTAEGFQKDRFIIIDPDVEYKNGNYVIAKKEGYNELLFRKYINDAGRISLAPLSRMFDRINFTQDIKICGVVVAYLDLLI